MSRSDDNLSRLIEEIPFAKMLDLQIQSGTEPIFVLPAREENIGNPLLPALHGGCIGGFLESAAIIHVMNMLELSSVPKVIDFSIDFLRPGLFLDSYARCNVVRQGKRIINVNAETWQTSEDKLIANARLHLLISSQDS